MGVRARRCPNEYAIVLRHPSMRGWASLPVDAPLVPGVSLADFLSAPYDTPDIGLAVFQIAYWQISARAGLLARYGRAGPSMLFSAARKHRILEAQWHENFLGRLLMGPSSQSNDAKNYQVAADHLVWTIALREGLSAAMRFVETYFNPLDTLGSDLGSILALKDAKTTLHDMAQAHGLRLVPVTSRTSAPNTRQTGGAR